VDQLTGAIRTVAAGGSVIDPRVVSRLVNARARGRSPLSWLTHASPMSWRRWRRD
jgi:DNA-binding NarL/FixJ family response regulator